MASYVVLLPPDGGRERAALLRDGWSLAAFVFPVFWLLWHRLWWTAALVFAAQFGLNAAGEALGGRPLAVGLTLLVGAAVALEGRHWRIAARLRRGWRDAGVVEAGGLDEAELRFFLQEAAAGPAEVLAPARPALSRPASAGPAPLGLLGYR